MQPWRALPARCRSGGEARARPQLSVSVAEPSGLWPHLQTLWTVSAPRHDCWYKREETMSCDALAPGGCAAGVCDDCCSDVMHYNTNASYSYT